MFCFIYEPEFKIKVDVIKSTVRKLRKRQEDKETSPKAAVENTQARFTFCPKSFNSYES